MPFGQVQDTSTTLFRQLSQFKLGKSGHASTSASSYIPECPLSPRSSGSFWSDSDSEDEGEIDGEEECSFDGGLSRLADHRESRQMSRDSQWTVASSEGSSSFGYRGGDASTRQSSRSSTSTLRSECYGSMKAVFPPQIFDGVQAMTSPTDEDVGPLQAPVRPPLKTHSSFPIPSSPVLPDVFLDGTVKATTGAQLAPWALSGASLRPRPTELERRRSWQSPPTNVNASNERPSSALRPKAATIRSTVAGKDREDVSGSSVTQASPNKVSPPRTVQTTGPSFVSRFQAPTATPRTPVEEQRERISRMAAQVVSSFSPYDTPEGTIQETSSAGIGLGLEVGGDEVEGLSTPAASLRTNPNNPAMWSTGSSPGSIWGPEASLTAGTESLKSSKRTSMPPPPRREGPVSRTAYNTPLILQTNSPSMRFSPALGATAQSSWSSGPYSASPRPDCRSPFTETVEEVATGSTPLLRPSNLSPALNRRGSVGARRASFCSSPLASQPVTEEEDTPSAPESPSLELNEVQYLLGFVQRQIEKLSTPKATSQAQFEAPHFASLAEQRLSTTSDAASYDWSQFRNSSIISSNGDPYSRQGSLSGGAQLDNTTRPMNWPPAAYPLSHKSRGNFNPSSMPVEEGNAGFPRSPSLPSMPSSFSPPRATLAPSVSDSWLSSGIKAPMRITTQPPIPVIVDTPATPLRDVTAYSRPALSELPRRSLPGLSPPKGDDFRASFSSEMGEIATRRKPTKRGTRSGKRVQKARSERALRLEAQKAAGEMEEPVAA